jgi:ParB family chromosome partitioning protein
MAKKSGMGQGGVRALFGAKQKTEKSISDLRIDKVGIETLVPGVYQPRYTFDNEALQELADSIRIQGIIQPIVVKSSSDDKYEIIAGERRWRAAKIAGLLTVPVVIRQADNQTTLAMALIENIQREDLNPIEVALGLKRLMKEFDINQQGVADAVGRSRTSVTNLLRLLKLPEKIQENIHVGELSMGHARAIVTLPEEIQLDLSAKSIAKDWTVRQMEQAVQSIIVPVKPKQKAKVALSAGLLSQEKALTNELSADVKIKHQAAGKGKIEISYKTEEELNRLLSQLSVSLMK